MQDGLYKDLTYKIIGAAMEVHKQLGPGFLEAVYQKALEQELNLRKIPFRTQQIHSVKYKGIKAGSYKSDIVVDQKVVLELKAISDLDFQSACAQLMSYLAATGYVIGLLFNFAKPKLQYKRILLPYKLQSKK